MHKGEQNGHKDDCIHCIVLGDQIYMASLWGRYAFLRQSLLPFSVGRPAIKSTHIERVMKNGEVK
jgi:hypothetical protein